MIFIKKFSFLCLLTLILCSCKVPEGADSHDANTNYNKKNLKTPSSEKCAWTYLRDNFELQDIKMTKEIQSHIDWIAKNPTYIRQFVERATPYINYIINEVHKNEFPAEIALLPMIESEFDPFAHSHAGASGLWQMMPGTATGFGVKQNWWYDGRRDLVDSTKAAMEYLRYLHKFFSEDWLLALAAYNSGEGTIKRAMKKNISKGKPTDFWSLEIPNQTKKYVPKLIALALVIKTPEKYNITLPEFNNLPYFNIVNINSQMDLNIAANLADIKVSEIFKLNPGYNRWLTTPNEKNKLLLPIKKVAIFKKNLSKVGKNKHLSKKYKIKAGDTLIALGHKFNTPVQIIKEINHLKSNFIRENQEIIIPTNQTYDLKKVKMENPNFFNRNNKNCPIKKIVYEVKKNDSFANISKKFNVTIAALEFWNKVSHHRPLKLKQKLIIWYTAAKKSHIVKRGETLSVIAQKYNTSMVNILKFNNIKSMDFIKIGQKLIIQT